MSGHSKWSKIKRQKEATDAKRSGLFTKLAKIIAVAARDGDDPKFNFKLQIAIDQAKAMSMPKANIERAIARGSGKDGSTILETVLYEGFGPDGIAMIVEAVTDNKNRTVSEIKHTLSKHGGRLAGSGSVNWMFDLCGMINVAETSISEAHELTFIDAGIVDIISNEEGTTIITPLDKLQAIGTLAHELQLSVSETVASYMPKDTKSLENPEKLIKLLEALDELEDLNNIYTNADF